MTDADVTMAAVTATIVSIQVGLPRVWDGGAAPAPLVADPSDKPWESAIVKAPVTGPVFAGRLNLAGDAQADLKHHGGPDKAICAYAIEHYAAWARTLRPAGSGGSHASLPPAAFGENFTLRGVTEADICIGDIWEAGTIAVQVSQPRQPCWKLARRWGITDLAHQVQLRGWTGWYFRVLREGVVQAGDALRLTARPNPIWTVAEANAVLHVRRQDREAAAALAAVPELSENWKRSLTTRVQGGAASDPALRLGFTPPA